MPTNLTACQALIEQLACTVDSQTNVIETLRQEKEEIELAFNLWMHRIFAKRSERYLDDPNQLKLDLGGDDNAAEVVLEVTWPDGSRQPYTIKPQGSHPIIRLQARPRTSNREITTETRP